MLSTTWRCGVVFNCAFHPYDISDTQNFWGQSDHPAQGVDVYVPLDYFFQTFFLNGSGWCFCHISTKTHHWGGSITAVYVASITGFWPVVERSVCVCVCKDTLLLFIRFDADNSCLSHMYYPLSLVNHSAPLFPAANMLDSCGLCSFFGSWRWWHGMWNPQYLRNLTSEIYN